MKTSRLLAMLPVIILAVTATYGNTVPQLVNLQGLLTDEAGEAVDDGIYVTAFAIYDVAEGGEALWQEIRSVTIKDGLFTIVLGEVTPIPTSIFATTDLWLGIALSFESEMTPRQRLTSVPYALKAEGMGSSYWYLADSVLYTSDHYGLARGGAESAVLGSHPSSMVNLGVQCTTGVAGASELNCTIGGGAKNRATMTSATIAGGYNNLAKAAATVCGGASNRATGDYSHVGGGSTNAASAYGSVVCGGDNNYATGASSFVGGGSGNIAAAPFSAILGGYSSTIAESADYSCLFGIDATLDSDSTFLVDMPHIHFGSEAFGYEFPTEDGVAGQSLVTNGVGQLNWSEAPAGGGWVDDGSSIRLATYTDKVGIGTTTPGAKLDVVGHGRFHGYNPPPSGEGLELAYDYVGNVGFLISADRDASNFGSLRLDGSVGIGTSTPQNKLDVEGGAVIGAAYSGTQVAPVNGLAVEGSVGIGNFAPLSKLDVEGGAVIGSGYAGKYVAPTNGLAVQGNVGIGTVSPSSPLEVKGDNPEITVNTTAAGALAGMRLQDNGTTQWSMAWNRGSKYLYFYHNASPAGTRMVISDTSGYVGIGEGNPAYKLDVNGDIECTALHETSDDRLKTNVRPLSNTLDKLALINGVTFDWNEEAAAVGADPGEHQIGLLASEVEAVFSELVSGGGDSYRSVDYSKLVAVLIEAVKELRADNSTLRERIERLEAEK